MSLTLEPQQGIRLDLTKYHRIRTHQGGGEFWEHENQQVLRQYLGDFLPTAEVNASGGAETVLYSQRAGSEELLSRSVALGEHGAVASGSQLELLRQAVARLKERETDPRIDADSRELIKAFRLPDPAIDPQLYRLCPGSPRRLLVLWGVERDADSALLPAAAVARLPAVPEKPINRKLLLALAALVILGGLLWWFMHRDHERARVALPAPVAEETPKPPLIADPSAPTVASEDAHPNVVPGAPEQATNPVSTPKRLRQPVERRPQSSDALNASPHDAAKDARRPELKPSRVAATPAPLAAPAGQGQTAASPAQASEVRLVIAQTSLGTEVRDGQVELVLNVLGRDTQNALQPLQSIQQWTIDGISQRNETSGKPVTTSQLPVRLPKGTHRCTVDATDAAGRPLHAEAELKVDLEVEQKVSPKVEIIPAQKEGAPAAQPRSRPKPV